MAFFRFDDLEHQLVTPRYSTAYGPLVTGTQIEVGRLRFRAEEGAVLHAHPRSRSWWFSGGGSGSRSRGRHATSGRARGFWRRPTRPTRSPPWTTPRCSAVRGWWTDGATGSRPDGALVLPRSVACRDRRRGYLHR